jgi:hypothetical protein
LDRLNRPVPPYLISNSSQESISLTAASAQGVRFVVALSPNVSYLILFVWDREETFPNELVPFALEDVSIEFDAGAFAGTNSF